MRFLSVMLFSFMFIIGLVQSQDSAPLILVTHDSFSISEGVLAEFEDETGISVQILRTGDAGSLVNQAILTRNNPLGDVLFGVDNTFLSRALNANIFEPYESPLLETVDPAFILDESYAVTPIDYGDVCINYDVAYFKTNDLPLPQTLSDLTLPEYEGLLVLTNPATSSPGLAFLMATIAEFGEDGEYDYLDFWEDLIENDVLITDGWSDAYYGVFSAPGRDDGTRPLVLSYASSPPVEFFFSDPAPETAVTGAIVADGTCFRQIEFAGILAGSERTDDAQQLIDFMLSLSFQEDMPLQMFVYPVQEEAELPEIFTAYSAVPENPGALDYDLIEAKRDEWISAWTELVLR